MNIINIKPKKIYIKEFLHCTTIVVHFDNFYLFFLKIFIDNDKLVLYL